MEGLVDLLKQRRIWVALIPVVVMVANAIGVPVTEGMLQDTGDKVVVAVTSLLALWSYFAPKVGR